MDTQETVMGIDAREICRRLRVQERNAIANADWDLFWTIYGLRMQIARDYFPTLFFGRS